MNSASLERSQRQAQSGNLFASASLPMRSNSRSQSDRFLYDFRRTIADLMASEHYGTVAAVAQEHQLKLYYAGKSYQVPRRVMTNVLVVYARPRVRRVVARS